MIFEIVHESDKGIILKEVVFGEAWDLIDLLFSCGFAYRCRLVCYDGYENAVEIFS